MTWKGAENNVIKCSSIVKFYVDDVHGRFMQRLAHYVYNKDITKIHGIYVISFNNDAMKKAWLASTGVKESELVYASSEKINKIQYVSSHYSTPKDVKHSRSAEFILNTSLSDRSYVKVRSEAFCQKNFDLRAGGVYMHIDKFYCNPLGLQEATVEPLAMIAAMSHSHKNFSIDFPEIACFKADTIAKISNNPKWKSFKQFTQEWIAENWTNQRQKITDCIALRKFVYSNSNHATVFAIAKLRCNENLIKFSDHVNDMTLKNGEDIVSIFQKAGIISLVEADKPSFNLSDEFTEIFNDHPLLNFIDFWKGGNSKDFLKTLTQCIVATGKSPSAA